MNTKIKGTLIPTQHAKAFKLAVAVTNSAKALEEYSRELKSTIRLKEKVITNGSVSSIKKIEPISYINQLANEAIDMDKIKELNKHIDKTFVPNAGTGIVNDWTYEMQEVIKDFYCLSLGHQKEVKALIDKFK